MVGFSAGGGVDIAARLVARRLTEVLRLPVLVENRPGAGSTLAAAQVLQAARDGSTVMVAETALLIGPVLYPAARYDPVADFIPVMRIATAPLGIAATASLGLADLRQALERARAAPAPWRFGTPGVGTAHHLVGEMLRQASGVELEHVPYRGGAPAVTALRSGETELSVASLPSIVPALGAGGVDLLAVTSANRLPGLPHVPAAGETLPGFEAAPGIYMLLPAGTGRHAVERLSAACAEAAADAELRHALSTAGLQPAAPVSPEELASIMAQEARHWSALARATGARLE
ncbi:hypothetical protein J8J14_03965 [Roseomonas sp. SSH11]|uniref:Tripartite tricarboxylate transporter substrate binding protein n=1 Tax=Pararoseomonas baculiformis TaxID=2820812 RepID=A0ABS4AA96_9PROT|nr:hypothetical protein [Pararoseomonas baculiformis]